MNEDKQDGTEVDEKPLVEKLVDWKKPPTIEELKQDLTDAKINHDTQMSKISDWLDNLNVEGKAKPPTVKGSSSIQPKLIRKQAEWRYAALSEPFLSTDDIFNVKPVTAEDREAAQQNELVLNHQFNTKIDKVTFIDEYVRAAVDEGTVFIRTGWCFQEEEEEVEVPDVEFRVNPELAPMHEQLSLMQEQNPSLYATDVPEELKQAHDLTVEHGEPIEAVVKGTKMETRKKVVANHPTMEVWPSANVVLDPTCQGNVDKASFVVFSFESSLAELEKDGKYKNLKQIQVSNNSILSQPDHAVSKDTGNFNFKDEPRAKIIVYEYWGKRDIDGSGKLVPIVAAWVGNTLIRLERNPFPDQKLPLVVAQYLPIRKSIYGEPDGALLEDNQKIIGAVTRGMIDIMGKSANGQTGMRKDMLDATNRRKYDNGQDYEFNQNVDPRLGVFMHTYPEIPASAQFMLQLQNMEAESMTGVKSFANGVSGQSLGDVAAAVRGALDAASKRELGILRRLSNGLIKVGRKVISMNAEFLSDEEVVRITDEEFVNVRRDDLPGNFDLKLSISTAEEDNNKAEQLAFLLQTVGPNGDPALVKMILSDIAKLRKMPDLAKRIETFEPQPDPKAQAMAELELAKIEAEVAEIRAKTQKLLADAGLVQAKVGTEGAKAAHLKSDTDLRNLEFVEQESGVHHEREKELRGEQSRAQLQTKLIDHDIADQDRKFELVKEYLKQKSKSNSK
jgi:hypothetical protein